MQMSLGAALLVLGSTPTFAQNQLIDLGIVSPYAASADGLTVVGGNGEPFLWTQDSGVLNLGFQGLANGVSADGSVIVGGTYPDAFIWTESGGMVELGTLPGTSIIQALGVSDDGLVVVGSANSRYPEPSKEEGFRWTESTGMVGLGDLEGGGFFSWITAVNSDGSVIVGQSWSANGLEAIRWTESGGMVGLGDLPGGDFYGYANAVSPDGSVVVGASSTADGDRAFRWKQDEGMIALGDLPGVVYSSVAFGVSADGKVVVGESYGPSVVIGGIQYGNIRAFRWLEGTGEGSGIHLIYDLLMDSGVNVEGWHFKTAWAVSDDGSRIVGTGRNPDGTGGGWIAVIGTGLVSVSDFANSIGSTQASANAANGMVRANLALAINHAARNGSFRGNQSPGAAMIPWSSLRFASSNLDGLSLADRGDSGATSLWTSGAYRIREGDSMDDSALVGSFGITKQISSSLRFGVGANLGDSEVLVKGPEGNDSERITHGLQAFAAFEPDTSPVRIYLGAVSMKVDDDLVRNYLNGVEPVSSKGNREGSAYGGSVILGLEYSALGNGSIMPFTEYKATRIDLDGYEETTGPFPAEFFPVAKTTQIAKLGVELGRPLSERLGLWGSLARAHRLDDKLPEVSGYIPVLSEGFSFNGTLANQDWTEARLGLNGQLKDNISVHISFGAEIEKDEDTSYGGSIGFNIRL